MTKQLMVIMLLVLVTGCAPTANDGHTAALKEIVAQLNQQSERIFDLTARVTTLEQTRESRTQNTVVPTRTTIGGDIMVGDVMQDMRVTNVSIDGMEGDVQFEGRATVSGSYVNSVEWGLDIDATKVCMLELDEASRAILPRLDGDDRDPWFCFSNPSFAKQALTPPGSSGTAQVVIDQYRVIFGPSEFNNTATLVDVISHTPSP